jgi:Spondin_N
MRSFNRLTRRALGALVLVAAGCATPAVVSADGGRRPPSQPPEYEIRLVNVTRTQWLTPPVVAVHERRVDVYTRGRPASQGVSQIAENGNVDPLVEALTGARGVASVEVATSADEPPLAPDEETTVTLTGSWRANRLSLVSMLICTNDGFTGLDGLSLPTRVGQARTFYGQDFDAGSEVNTEDMAHLVPPCQALNGVADDEGAPGTGMSDPELAERSVVRSHRGVTGIADLTPEAHGWDTSRPIVEVVVTRVA